MKQTTILDYFLNLPKQIGKKRCSAPQKIEESFQNKNGLIKTYVQKNLSQLIKEQEEFQKVKDLLGTSWHRQKNGFGFTDKDNIMIVSTIQDFNTNFFNLYKFEDFVHIIDLSLEIEDLKEDKTIFIKINEIEYNSYYLFKAFRILGDQIKCFQHKTLKLLYLINIGAGTAEKLNARKIFYYRQLAESTPEKLSEAPGIGIATAKIFIEEAKKLLERIQEQEDDGVKLPEPAKAEPIIVQEAKEKAVSEELEHDTYEILENEVEEDSKPKEVTFQRSDTPYKQLLERPVEVEKVEEEIEVEEYEDEEDEEIEEYQEDVQARSRNEINVEPFESEMSAPDKELPGESKVQKKWFSDKFNRSRLTASRPSIF